MTQNPSLYFSVSPVVNFISLCWKSEMNGYIASFPK